MHLSVDQYQDFPRSYNYRSRPMHHINYDYYHHHPPPPPPPWDQGPFHFAPPLPPPISPVYKRPHTRNYRYMPHREGMSTPSPNLRHAHPSPNPRHAHPSPNPRHAHPSPNPRHAHPSPNPRHAHPSPNRRHAHPSPVLPNPSPKTKQPTVVTDAIQPSRKVSKQQDPLKGRRKRKNDTDDSKETNKREETKRVRLSNPESKTEEASSSPSVICIDSPRIPKDNSLTRLLLQPDNDRFKHLTSQIFEYDDENKPSSELTDIKLDYCAMLSRWVERDIHHPRFVVYGSSLNGFSTNSSDLDITLLVNRNDLYTNPLRRLYRCINKHRNRIGGCQLISAKVPIVMFEDKKCELEVDISLNNHSGIRNTFLLRTYSRLDVRVRPLVVVVKEWAKSNDVCNSKSGLLSSYALYLMVIFFLQHAVSPPLLPSLQRMFPDTYNAYYTIDHIKNVNIEDICRSWVSENKLSVGELLIKFFEFYANLDFRGKLISIRTGSLHDRPYWDSGNGYKGYINIEEPYTLENAARSVYLLYRCKHIINEFKIKHIQLSNKDQSPKSLDDIFSKAQ